MDNALVQVFHGVVGRDLGEPVRIVLFLEHCACGHVPAVRNLDAHEDAAWLDNTVSTDLGLEHQRFHAHEAVVAHARRAVDLDLMSQRDPLADVHGILFPPGAHEILLNRLALQLCLQHM